MRARITLAIVAILAGALAFAGVLSISLGRRAVAHSAQVAILRQAVTLTDELRSDSALFPRGDPKEEREVLTVVRKVAGFDGAGAIVVERGTRGHLVARPAPQLISGQALDVRRLARGKSTSGVDRGIAFAAAPLFSLPASFGEHAVTVSLLLESKVGYSSDNVLYFLLAGGIALVAAAAVAAVIAKRISRRVVAASQTATRIAAGDFQARVALPPNDYPELAGLGASLNTMAAALARSRHLEREFLLSISHDLRTPLTSIRGYSEAIAEGAAPDPPRAAQIVVAEAERLERLIGDLLDLARLDARQFSLRPAAVDAGACAGDAAEALRYEFEASDVALDVRRPDAQATVWADPDRLAQVVANLVENALTFAQSHVRVSTVVEVTTVRISVVDDGPGIAADDLPFIFDRLFSSRRHPARSVGTGLGLAIVAELVGAMDGRVLVDSPLESAGGTAITVVLPRVTPGTDAAPT